MKNHLLFELGAEELPPKALKKLATALADNLQAYLLEHQFISDANQVKWFATPRRLAVRIEDVLSTQPTQIVERKGPAIKAAFDAEGNPSKAAQGFMRSVGVDNIAEIDTLKTDQGEWLYYKSEQDGKPLTELVEEGINQAIKKLPIPKRMRWGDSSIEFVRPVHWVILMHGDTVLPCTILGIESGNQSSGHRFHCNGLITINHVDEYEQKLLLEGKVVVDYEKRLASIDKGVRQLAKDNGINLVEDESLLNEVTALVELPVPMIGKFDEEFLALPKEVLISSMRDHQKYFSLTLVGKDQASQEEKLAPYFITISNIESKNPAQVQHGNERVLRARLADAQFFWQQDQKTSLASNVDKLAAVLFHHKLGSVADKVERLKVLGAYIANAMQLQNNAGNADNAAITAKAEQAASLIKADLVSGMVGEFPELQGIIGRYYATAEGVDSEVAQAIEQHYLPKQAGDNLPTGDIATALALADKLDTIVGIFLADEIPTGDKDPFALRRQALGILRMLIEKSYPFAVADLVEKSVMAYQGNAVFNADNAAKKVQQISAFINERLKNYYQAQGIDTNVYLSVAEVKPAQALDFNTRVFAVDAFRQSDAADSLAAANKRIRNILEKSDASLGEIDTALLVEPAEKSLVDVIKNIAPKVSAQMAEGEYFQALQLLSELKEPVDAFFDDVKVMDDNEAIKLNRLAILSSMRKMFIAIADISYLNQ